MMGNSDDSMVSNDEKHLHKMNNKVTNSQKRHEEGIESISVVFDSSVFVPMGSH